MFILSSHKDGRGASSPVPSFPWPRLPSGSTFLHWFSLFWGQIWNAFKTSQLRVWSATLVFCKRHCREEQTRNQTERDFLCPSSWVPISSAPESNFVISSIAALKLRSKFKEETDGGYMEWWGEVVWRYYQANWTIMCHFHHHTPSLQLYYPASSKSHLQSGPEIWN